jgi:SAM-dependent methyltransferase
MEWLANKLLAVPFAYDFSQWLVGARRCHAFFMSEMVRPQPGERVLDVGCGVGACLRDVPDKVEYVGIDLSAPYIEAARAQYGDRGTFICADVASVDASSIGTFDRAFSHGLLHHLPDEAVAHTVDLLQRVVRPGGIYVTLEPCYLPDQSSLARFLIANDRGKFVRDQPGWEHLVSGLGTVHSHIFHDLLNVPYTLIIMQVTLPRSHALHGFPAALDRPSTPSQLHSS